jgi:hypothetical protein
MRFFSKAAVATAAAGLAAVGAVTAGGGVANAATGQVAVSCSTNGVVLTAGVLPSCSEGDTTVVNPTSFTLTTSSPGLTGTVLSTLQTDLGGLLGGLTGTDLSDLNNLISNLQNLTENVSFDVNCSVNGSTATKHESFTALPDGTSQVINLQSAVGAPAPNNCTIANFTVSGLVSLSALDIALLNGLPSSILSTSTGLLGIPLLPTSLSGILSALGLPSFTGLTTDDTNSLLGLDLSAELTANTAVPGAVWQEAAKTSGGLDADVCADDANNGNAGAKAQVYQCESDLGQSFVQASTGQLVHNGVCLTQSGSTVSMQACSTSSNQVWNTGTGAQFNEIINASSHQCLTAPKAQDAVQLTGTACASKADQMWKAPAKSAA